MRTDPGVEGLLLSNFHRQKRGEFGFKLLFGSFVGGDLFAGAFHQRIFGSELDGIELFLGAERFEQVGDAFVFGEFFRRGWGDRRNRQRV